MIDKPYKLFIGKDIDRTTALTTGGENFSVVSANIAEGEIIVLDKNMNAFTAGEVFANSDTMYIAEGTSRTISLNDELGNAITGRHILLSDAIKGKLVRNVAFRTFSTKTECTATIAAITDAIVAGTEYVLKVIYKDMEEHPASFTQTYRYIAKTGDTSQLVFNGLRARIAKHSGTRVTASGTTTLILTGKEVPASTSSLADIDEFKMVDFEVVFNYVNNDYNQVEVGLASDISITTAHSGSGNWEQIRDLEKFELGYRGVSNRTHWPVAMPDFRTEKSAEYDVLVIEYDADYRSPDNSYEKFTSKQLILAMEVSASEANDSAQYFDVLGKIADWCDSLPFETTFVEPEVKTTVDATAIADLTAPVTGATPVSTITAGTGYTGTVTWAVTSTGVALVGTFAATTAYTATVTIIPTTGYTLDGVTANQFTFTGSATDTNAANSGICTVTFAATTA